MKNYHIYIKSHSESPDYESECDAKNIEEAAEIFAKSINVPSNDDCWEPKDLIQYIEEVTE